MYRRKNKKGSIEEVVKKRTRRGTKAYRPITGATLESILQKRNQKPEVRKAQREEAIRLEFGRNGFWFQSFAAELPRKRPPLRRSPKFSKHRRLGIKVSCISSLLLQLLATVGTESTNAAECQDPKDS